MVNLLVPLDPHGHNVRARIGFENEACNTPLEVAHCALRVLVHEAFGEDVDPGVLAGRVGGWGWKGVGTVGSVRQVGLGERVGDLRRRGKWKRKWERSGKNWMVGSCIRIGEQTDGLRHGGLEQTAEGGVATTVSREDLT